MKLAFYLVLTMLALTGRTYAQSETIPPFCDAEIYESADKFGYRFRGDRCEGKYEQPTAAPSQNLTVISFSCPLPRLDLSSSKPTIAWASAGGSPVSIHLYVDDVDAAVERAIAAGAKLIRPVADQFYGDRVGGIEDPFGYRWFIATHKEDLTMDEIRRRTAAQAG